MCLGPAQYSAEIMIISVVVNETVSPPSSWRPHFGCVWKRSGVTQFYTLQDYV